MEVAFLLLVAEPHFLANAQKLITTAQHRDVGLRCQYFTGNFMTANKPYIQLDEGCHFVLASVARLRQAMKEKMNSFASCKEVEGGVFENDPQLQILQDEQNDNVQFSYAGTSIRLRLVIGYKETDAVGKVLVTQEYSLHGKPESDKLGEFTIDERGFTNFIEQSGRPYSVKEAADLIVAYYLAEACKRTLSIFSR